MKTLFQCFQRPIALISSIALTAAALPCVAGPPRVSRPRINIDSHKRVDVDVRKRVDVNVDVRRRVDIDIDRRRPGLGAAVVAGLVTGMVIGAAVASPPRGYSTVYAGPNPYAYYGGVYYQPGPSGYVVVAPPVGVIVPVLPPGASVTVVNSTSYYVYNGLHYQPVFVNGVTQYRTIRF